MSEADASSRVIVDGIDTSGGLHCETTTLGVLLSHAGLELSEPMLFGLGGGLSFIYWDSKNQDAPFLGGRVKPFTLTENLVTRLGIDLRVQETSSPQKAWTHVRAAIGEGVPVGLQLDSHDLEYFTSRVHFAGHVVALYGYDEECAYLVDTAQQGGAVTTSLGSLAAARAAKGPMSARHRSFVIADLPSMGVEELTQAALAAIGACAREFLAPPIANVGHRGVRTAAKRVPGLLAWVATPARDLPLMGALMERAGTGGGLFRSLYRDFLVECRDRVGGAPEGEVLDRAAQAFSESSRRWTQVAELLSRAGETGDAGHLEVASGVLAEIADIETEAMGSLRTFGRD